MDYSKIYNPKKAAQVVAYFAQKSPNGRINVLKLVKLIYLADRESIKRRGSPILNEPRVSMPHGPVNSLTFSHINGDYDAKSPWAEIVSPRADHDISVKQAVTEYDEMSLFEIECLEHVWKKFGKMTPFEIRDWTHKKRNVPEWVDPEGSSRPIPIEKIMKAVGLKNVKAHARHNNEMSGIELFFVELREHARKSL